MSSSPLPSPPSPTHRLPPQVEVGQEQDSWRHFPGLPHDVHHRLLRCLGPRVREQRGEGQGVHREALQGVEEGGGQVVLKGGGYKEKGVGFRV